MPLAWQERVLREVFGTIDSEGNRQYRKVYIEVPKKNGKSTLAAGVALYLLLADDEPTPEVYGAANAREQAKIVYDEARRMVEQNETLRAHTHIYNSVTEIRRKKGGRYKALSKDAKNFHGLNPHGLIIDELHSFRDREMYDVLTESSTTARSQPLIWIITTAGVDRTSLCWEVHEYAKRVHSKELDDDRFYPVLYGAEDDDDWTSPAVWKKANPSYELFNEHDITKDCREAQSSIMRENNFRHYRLNQWVKQSTRFLSMFDWDACVARKPIEDHEVLYGGLDLSTTRDLTAFVLVGEDANGVFHAYPMFWIPEDTVAERMKHETTQFADWVGKGYIKTTPGKTIEYAILEEDILELCERYPVRKIGFDPSNATHITQRIEARIGEDILIPMRQNYSNMSPPTKHLDYLVSHHAIAHGDNPVLRWNADNLAVREGPTGNILPTKQSKTQKIDGIVALIMAVDAAIRFKDDDDDWSDEIEVYEL